MDASYIFVLPLLYAVSAADQYELLQLKNKRWLFHHTAKLLVQFHEPLDQRGEVHCVQYYCSHAGNSVCCMILLYNTFIYLLYLVLHGM